MKLSLDARNKLLERLFVAIGPRLQQPRKFVSFGGDHSVLKTYSFPLFRISARKKPGWPVSFVSAAFLDVRRAPIEEGVVKQRYGLELLLGLFLVTPHIVYGKSNEQQQRLGFTLAVCDLTGLAPEILATARQHAVRIVRSAGVAVTWLDLDSRAKCSIPNTASRHFVVVILPKAPSGWTSPDAMGLAPGRTGLHPRAYVFYNYVQIAVDLLEPGSRRNSGLGILLGHVIAHELGHLLIPGDAHSLTGIMSTQWTYRQWEDIVAERLLFDGMQAKAIHRHLEGE